MKTKMIIIAIFLMLVIVNAFALVASSQDGSVPNPPLPEGGACGLDIVLVLDSSDSLNRAETQEVRDAASAFVTSLSSTPSKFSVVDFDTEIVSSLPFTDDISAVVSAINSIGHDSSTELTNWHAALTQAQLNILVGDDPDLFNLVIIITDGDPTTYGYPTSLGSYGGAEPDSEDIDYAVQATNSLKENGTRILAIGVTSSPTVDTLIDISGPNVDTGDLTSDVITTDIEDLADILANFAYLCCELADLSIEKTDSADPVYAGDSFTYTLNVTNLGPHESYDLNITDELPNGLIFNSANPVPTGGVFPLYYWHVTSLDAAESLLISINVTVDNGVSGVITNNANVYNHTRDLLSDNNFDSEETTVIQTCTLSVDIVGSGSVVNDPDQVTYVYGSLVDLSAVADLGWTFSHWSGDLSGSVNPESVVMDGDKSVTAHFTQDYYTLTSDTVGNGTLTIVPAQEDYIYGDIINLDATADIGWSFSHWSVDLDGENSNESIFMNSNKHVIANFIEDSYSLNITIVGSGIVIKNPDQNNYTYGKNVEITVVPASGWKFKQWSGDIAGDNDTEIVNMADNKFITAHFAKKSSSSGGGGGIPLSDDSDPTANAGGPYFAAPDEELDFNGTNSHDNDESGSLIVRYDWRFYDDGEWYVDIGPRPNFTYNAPGVYNVTLRVYDDEDASDENVTTATIIQPNREPSIPDINGPVNGSQNTSYTFFVVSTDEDDWDLLKYTIDWNDGDSSTTDFVPPGTETSADHMWYEPGIYTISVIASDNQTTSGSAEHTILIDVLYVKDIGHLIDNDSDGTYDDFFSNLTENITNAKKRDDGKYLINDDGDEEWDWVYDPETDTLEPYTPPDEEGFNLFWLLALLLILIIIFIYYETRRKKKQGENPPPAKK